MTDWDARDLVLDLSFLPAGGYTIEIFMDGVNADRAARDYKKIVVDVQVSDNKSTSVEELFIKERLGAETYEKMIKNPMPVHMAPGGGFAAKIVKK